MMFLNQLQLKQYDFVERQGWHNKSRLEYLALVASEVGEAVNAARGDTATENYYFELADIVLRVLDLAEVEGIALQDYIIKKMELNETRDFTGKKL